MKSGIIAAAAALLFAAWPACGQDTVSSFFEEEVEGAPPGVRIDGEVGFSLRAYPDLEDPGDSRVAAWPEARIGFTHRGESVTARADFQCSRLTRFESFENLINEAYLTLHGKGFDLHAGYLKVVWGTGDGTHAVDVLNPLDYTDFVLPEYAERNIAEKMVKLDLHVGAGGLLEVACVPLLHPDRYALEGPWVPDRIKTIIAKATLDDELEQLEQELAEAPPDT
ncbi:MAG: hypothetical protein ACOC8N_08560, partial [Spirochaetota bacterium]